MQDHRSTMFYRFRQRSMKEELHYKGGTLICLIQFRRTNSMKTLIF